VKSAKYLIIIGFLSIALIASLFVVVRTTTTYQRASGSSSDSTVLENSYLFASPLQAKADGKEMVRVTVFLLDCRGLGVGNQTVNLKLPNSVTVNNQQEITDQSGKAIFDISSVTAQTINITATTNNLTLPQKVRVVFY
jgi:hypothetical protein